MNYKESEGQSQILKKDLKLEEYFEMPDSRKTFSQRQLLGIDSRAKENSYHLGADLEWGQYSQDFEIVSEEDNLIQAILHRFRTSKGELTDTGHPNYGSEIYKMVGEPNTERTRDVIKLIVRDTLLQERRIKEIRAITVTPGQEPDYVDIEILIKSLTKDHLLRLSTQYSIENGEFRNR